MSRPTLVIRTALISDLEGIFDLVTRAYPGFTPYPRNMLRGQINAYPEGHFVAEYEGTIVGYCATIRIPEAMALGPHTWREVTGGGYGSSHTQGGEYLYGYEVCVDPKYRRLKIGQRFYKERRKLCLAMRIKGIVFAGRMPLLAKNLPKVGTVEKYIELVKAKKIRDPVLSFQIRSGFEIIGILKDYLPADDASMGYAAHLLWKNPEYEAKTGTTRLGNRVPDTIRVSVVQYQQRTISSFDEFKGIVTYFVDVVADYQSDFVCFPELFSLQLLSIEQSQLRPHQAVAKLAEYRDALWEFYSHLAIKYNINIIAGSHPVKIKPGVIQNVSAVFLRDGSVHEQPKIHPTPNERYWWNIQGGDSLKVIQTDCGPIGVLVCYDAEFPELARNLVDQGAAILFIPFLTDERQSYCRVRYCAHARAVENQCYVVMAGNVGNLPRVQNADIHYAQSCILSPCDFPFHRDGIAADTSPNVETVAFADIRLASLYQARASGTVVNLKDRRHDLYSVVWHKKD